MIIPNRKISEVILEFGAPLLDELPASKDRFELESAIKLVVAAWNAVILDQQQKTRLYEDELLKAIKPMPEGFSSMVKLLFKRKRREYGSDPRTVGHYEVVDRDGVLTLKAESKVDIEKIDAGVMVH